MDEETSTTYSELIHIDDKSNKCSCYNCLCCKNECLKWLFFNSSPAAYYLYDENTNYYCTFLDCCSWCLEFRYKENVICKKNTVLFLCCVSFIYY